MGRLSDGLILEGPSAAHLHNREWNVGRCRTRALEGNEIHLERNGHPDVKLCRHVTRVYEVTEWVRMLARGNVKKEFRV